MGKRVGMISLGCAKNQVNAEQMLYRLQEAGYTLQEDVDGADLVIVNTCGFIDSAKSEAIDNILAMGALKQEGRIGRLLVTGCLSQRYQDEILQEMPEVDGVLGTGSYDDIVSVADRLLNGGETVSEFGDIDAPADEAGRVLTTPQHYAYIKIAEGCNNFCAFCIIPHLRGRYRSRAVEDILQEARGLAESGVKELIVVAQDTSRYGTDLYGAPRLPLLLHELCRIEGFHWIRVHYLYPDMITDELLDTFASEPKLVNYMDIPIQHVNDAILRRMNRRGTRAELDEMLQKLRSRLPDAVIRTSLITGLPGEGEAEFEELCAWLRENKLERVGAFLRTGRPPQRWSTQTRRSPSAAPRSSASCSRASWMRTTQPASGRSWRCFARARSLRRAAASAGPMPTRPISTVAYCSLRRAVSLPVSL